LIKRETAGDWEGILGEGKLPERLLEKGKRGLSWGLEQKKKQGQSLTFLIKRRKKPIILKPPTREEG